MRRIQISIRMSEPLLRKIDHRAEQYGLSRSDVIHRACEELFERLEDRLEKNPHRRDGNGEGDGR